MHWADDWEAIITCRLCGYSYILDPKGVNACLTQTAPNVTVVLLTVYHACPKCKSLRLVSDGKPVEDTEG